VALPTFAAVCHAAVQCQLLLTVRLMAMQQSIDIFWPPGPQQQTGGSNVRRPDGTDTQTHAQQKDPAPNATQAVPIICFTAVTLATTG